MKRVFLVFAAFTAISGSAYADTADEMAANLADCAAVYTLSASVIGNSQMTSDAPYETRQAAAKSYSLAAGKALKASGKLSDDMTASNRMGDALQKYTSQISADKNMNALMPQLLTCKVLVEKTSVN